MPSLRDAMRTAASYATLASYPSLREKFARSSIYMDVRPCSSPIFVTMSIFFQLTNYNQIFKRD